MRPIYAAGPRLVPELQTGGGGGDNGNDERDAWRGRGIYGVAERQIDECDSIKGNVFNRIAP